MKTPQQQAYNLYFNTNLTQKQIAEHIGVNPKTLYEWMKEGNWKTLKATSRLMPAQIVDDIYNHISHLNYNIKSRDFEQRYPSKDEAETLRKLIFSIPKVKLNVSKGESAQSMMNFVSWLQHRNTMQPSSSPSSSTSTSTPPVKKASKPTTSNTTPTNTTTQLTKLPL